MERETIYITDNKGNVVDKVKRKIHDLMIHSRDKNIEGLAIQTGYIVYKGKRFISGLERINSKQRWIAFAG